MGGISEKPGIGGILFFVCSNEPEWDVPQNERPTKCGLMESEKPETRAHHNDV